jgi:hypothetical protein
VRSQGSNVFSLVVLCERSRQAVWQPPAEQDVNAHFASTLATLSDCDEAEATLHRSYLIISHTIEDTTNALLAVQPQV